MGKTQVSEPVLSKSAVDEPLESESLDSIVRNVADALGVQVSSFYQWRADDNVLELAATVGLNTELVGSLRLRPDQGLTGLVAETRKPVSVKHPAKHPRYIFVPRSFEERLQSYLGVPVFRPVNQFVGVLTVQSESSRIFTPREISAVIQAASRLACIA
jgi:phosphotransferase system enzyme I (PtsP)